MGWLWLVASIKLQVSFAKGLYKRDNILQKRRTILSIRLTEATPYLLTPSNFMCFCYTCLLYMCTQTSIAHSFLSHVCFCCKCVHNSFVAHVFVVYVYVYTYIHRALVLLLCMYLFFCCMCLCCICVHNSFFTYVFVVYVCTILLLHLNFVVYMYTNIHRALVLLLHIYICSFVTYVFVVYVCTILLLDVFLLYMCAQKSIAH